MGDISANQLRPIWGDVNRAFAWVERFIVSFTGNEAGPGISIGVVYNFRLQRIGFDVSQNGQVMFITLDGEALESALIKMPNADSAVGCVITLSVSERYPPHVI